ncbi:MAG: hypothetical protein WAS21_06790 [Geminicoccaceae bacterium]
MTTFPLSALPVGSWPAITMPSGFNSLANAASTLSTGEIDNSPDAARYDWINVVVNLGSFSPSAGAVVEGTLVPKLNGSYPSIAGATWPIGSLLFPQAMCSIDSGSGAKIAFLGFRVVLPVPHKLLIRNGTGVAFAATGNSVVWAGALRETRTT